MKVPFRSALLLVPLLAACDAIIIVDDDTPLPRPASLTTTSLDGAIALRWSDEPYRHAPGRFRRYLVYSAPYDLDHDLCGSPFVLEGTTVAPEFVAGALTNGRPRCFAVTAESVDGIESDRSPVRFDTPRFEATAVAVHARQSDDARAGFRFWRDQDGDGRAGRSELARIGSGNGDVDFTVERAPTGRLYLVPVRSGTAITVYGDTPVSSLHEIDVAPTSGYATTPIEAVPGWGYVVEMRGPDGYKRYGALRVTWTGANYLLLDWAFQGDAGNPELLRVRP